MNDTHVGRSTSRYTSPSSTARSLDPIPVPVVQPVAHRRIPSTGVNHGNMGTCPQNLE